MAILPEERTENIVRSLYGHIETNYTLTDKWFADSNVLNTTALTEWVEFSLISSTGRFMRQVTESTLGDLTTLLLHVLICQRPTAAVTRVNLIRDTIANLLRRASIQILDYVGGGPALGKLVGEGLMIDAFAGRERDVSRYALTFGFRYLAEYSS